MIPEKVKPAHQTGGGFHSVEQLGGGLDLLQTQSPTLRKQFAIETINIEALRLDVRNAIATAKISEFENQSHRLGHVIAAGLLDRATAADFLYDVAIGNDLVFEHGDETIQAIMAEGFGGIGC